MMTQMTSLPIDYSTTSTMITLNKPWTAYKNGQNKIKCDLISTKLNIIIDLINQTTAGPTNITINNNNLEQVENYKYLG
jgi:hypothetical protein